MMVSAASRSRTASSDAGLVVWMLIMAATSLYEIRVEAASTLADWSEQGYEWPKGTYALPVTGAGQCPGSGVDTDEWRTGQLFQDVVQEWREDGRAVERGRGGWRDGPNGGEEYTLMQEQTKNSFCTKAVAGQFSRFEFMPGRYCVWKKHRCPDGFEDGWIQMDSQSTVTSSGTLPDGSYENLTVRLAFCCRSDGSPAEAIRLPDIRPFALLRLGHSPCQAVENMDASDGWSSWEGVATVSDGLYPEMDAGDFELETSNRTKVFSCVYRPRSCSGRCLAVFLDLFFASLVVGVLFFGVCYQLRKRCLRGSRGASTKLHFFYDEDGEDEEEDPIGYAPLLPFYDRRRCSSNRDGGQMMRDGDSREPGAVLVARLPPQPSTDDDIDDADEDDDDDEDEEEIAWDVTVYVQVPQQPTRHLAAESTDDVRSTAGPTDVDADVRRSSPPPPYEETAQAMEPPASATVDVLPTQEPTQR